SVLHPVLHVRYRMIRLDGSIVWLERNSLAYFDEQGRLRRIVGMVADITERKRAETMLRSMGSRLIEAQETERARIARDLHDDIGQRLALVSVRLDQLKHAFEGPDSAMHAEFGGILEQLSEISSSIHVLSHQLHSSTLKHLGVVASMRRFCKEISAQHAVEI